MCGPQPVCMSHRFHRFVYILKKCQLLVYNLDPQDQCVKTTLMNVPLVPLCINVPQIQRVSINQDGEHRILNFPAENSLIKHFAGIIVSAELVSKHIRIHR